MFWGKTLDYGYKNRLGTKIPNREQRALEVDDKPIKEFYDYRNEPFMVNNPRKNNIRDQGNCGASWAFSTLGNSFRILKKYIFYAFSSQYLFSMSTENFEI